MAGNYLLVDGHSVIFAWPELRRLHQHRTRAARERLIRQLQELHDTSSWAVTLVFDGKQGGPLLTPRDSLVVAYATQDQTADSVIEALVAAQKDRSRITVVTADEGERRTIESLGAFCVSPRWLEMEIGQISSEFTRETEKVRRKARW